MPRGRIGFCTLDNLALVHGAPTFAAKDRPLEVGIVEIKKVGEGGLLAWPCIGLHDLCAVHEIHHYVEIVVMPGQDLLRVPSRATPAQNPSCDDSDPALAVWREYPRELQGERQSLVFRRADRYWCSQHYGGAPYVRSEPFRGHQTNTVLTVMQYRAPLRGTLEWF